MSIKLRRRRLPGGRIQLYLAIYTSRNRRHESLNMFLTKSGPQNREVLRLAEAIRAKRELDVHADAEGITSPWKREANIFDYAQRVYEMKMPLTKRCYVVAFNHLKAFAGEHLSFVAVIERVCADFRTFLLARVSRNLAASYYARFKSILGLATKGGYLQRNPADNLNIHKVETKPRYLAYDQILQLEAAPFGNAIVLDAFLFAINTVCGTKIFAIWYGHRLRMAA